jgi:hypothetical protein
MFYPGNFKIYIIKSLAAWSELSSVFRNLFLSQNLSAMRYASSSLNYINCVSRDLTNLLESASNATSLFIGDGGGSSTAHFFYNGEHSAENRIKKEEKDTVRSVVLIRTTALILCLYYES